MTVQPLASVKEAARAPDYAEYGGWWGFNDKQFRVYGGYLNGQLVGFGVVKLDSDVPRVIVVHSAVREDAMNEAMLRRIALHFPSLKAGADSPEEERLLSRVGLLEAQPGLWLKIAGQEGKDILQAPIPFVYDVEKDEIEVGHPGQKTADVQGEFTPGGIVEGYYEPGGKMVITTKTSIPYTNYHMVQLWYWSHPTLEVTGVDYENTGQKKVKLASEDVGQYIRTLASADPAAWKAYQALGAAGGHVYVVGGAVRDALLQRQPKDIDLLVGGLPSEEVHRILTSLPGQVDMRGSRFGIYVYHTHGKEVEIALPRKDDYEGGKRADVKISADPNLPIEKDLERRDFTANSMAVDLNSGQLIDPFDGSGDISRGVLRTTHPKSFKEDPTRLMRALTATSRFGLEPDEKTRAEMGESAHMLDHESPDALRVQLEKLMVSANPARAVRLAQETGVLHHLFPELAENYDFDQHNPHHNYSLGDHSLQVLDNMARITPNPDMRLAALLHDIGKPGSQWFDGHGVAHYYPRPQHLDAELAPGGKWQRAENWGADHAALGANMAEARLRQTFNYPVENMRRIHSLINAHMFGNFEKPKGARKFLQQNGQHADDLLTLRECDGEGKGTESTDNVEQMRQLIENERQQGAPTTQSALAVNGNDIMGLGIKAGPQIGTILRQLTDDVVDDPKLNDREALLQRAQEYADAQPGS
jgi:tRNA nucleotidyltransferase (CCA-adding enzyme)